MAVSSLKCNASNEILLELREDFVGRLEAEDFARAVVQGMLNGSEFLMRDVAQVHAFGQEFADQAVGIFVGTALPRAVGIAKEDVHMQAFAQGFVHCHL